MHATSSATRTVNAMDVTLSNRSPRRTLPPFGRAPDRRITRWQRLRLPALVFALLALLVTLGASAGADAITHSPQRPFPRPHSGRFWHLTDIHLDPWYTPGAPPFLACHAFNNSIQPPNPHDGPETSTSPGKLGSPLTFCDTPPSLLNLTLADTRRITDGQVDFVVLTGDLARHDSNIFKSNQENLDLIRAVTDLVHHAWPSVPLLLSLGNNDVYPHNTLAPHSRFLSSMATIWSQHIPRDQLATFRAYGWYSRSLTRDLMGVSLNTIAFFSLNPNATDCMLDRRGYGAKHLLWLERHVLKPAKRLGKSVLISGHVPPEPNAWFAGCLSRYAQLASRYQEVVVGHLFGHVNLDYFVFLDPFPHPIASTSDRPMRLISSSSAKDNQQQPLSPHHTRANAPVHVTTMGEQRTTLLHNYWNANRLTSYASPSFPVALVSPSVIPNYLPSIRLFDYSMTQRALVNYHQYLLNLTTRANPLRTVTEPPHYTLEYSAREAYGLPDLTWQSYQQLALALVVPNPDERAQGMRDRFWRHIAVSTGMQ